MTNDLFDTHPEPDLQERIYSDYMHGERDLGYWSEWFGDTSGLASRFESLFKTPDAGTPSTVLRDNGQNDIITEKTNRGDEETSKVSTGSLVTINPNKIRYSQTSVNGSMEMIESMKANGWRGEPIDIVEMPDGLYTTVDNTRVVAARAVGIDVQARIHSYNEPLPIEFRDRLTTKNGVPTTWGEAVELRIGKQNAPFRNTYPSGSVEMNNINKVRKTWNYTI